MSTDELTTTGPARPIPPRSRARAHLVGLVLALIGAPVAYRCLNGAAVALERVYQEGRGPALGTYLLLAAGAVIIATTVWWNSRSCVGSAVAGTLWVVVSVGTVADLPWNHLLADVFGRQVESAGGSVLGLVLLGSAASASAARRFGRWSVRRDQRLVAASGVSAAPRGRLVGHLISVATGAVVGPLSVIVFLGFSILLLSRHAEGDATFSLQYPHTLVMLAVMLTALFVAAAWSSLGLVVAGTVWFVVGASSLLFPVPPDNPLRQPIRDGLQDVLHFLGWADAPWFASTLVIGVTLLMAALGVHLARRDGRAFENRELRLVRGR